MRSELMLRQLNVGFISRPLPRVFTRPAPGIKDMVQFKQVGMVYAKISIGVLGFIVWSYIMMALFFVKDNFFHDASVAPVIEAGNREVINFAICQNSSTLLGTLNSKNLNNYTQPAGNLTEYSSTSPSETTRETSFNFDLFFYSYGGPSGSDIDSNWLAWFIGFTEGDGYLGTFNNRLTFVIVQKEGSILYEIQKKLNIGNVCLTKTNIHRFSVDNQTDILKLAYIFNGNLILKHRIQQLSLWFSILNQKGYKLPDFNDRPLSPSLNDAWLSGFTDAEGCFNVGVYNRKDTKLVSKPVIKRFILDQNHFKNEFIHISNLFNSGFISARPKSTHQFRLTINSFKGLPLVISYFTNYPLKTKKKRNYLMWRECFGYIENKEHLTVEGMNKIKNLKTQINLHNSLNKKVGLALRHNQGRGPVKV